MLPMTLFLILCSVVIYLCCGSNPEVPARDQNPIVLGIVQTQNKRWPLPQRVYKLSIRQETTGRYDRQTGEHMRTILLRMIGSGFCPPDACLLSSFL